MRDDPLPNDRLPTRKAGPWARDKLGILEYYFPAFGNACSSWRRWHYVDGFAGPGVNTLGETEERFWGSPLLALRTQPGFHRCLLMDLKSSSVKALRARAAQFGDRAVVVQGDVNTHLLPAMHEHLDVRRPCLCVLDPEGLEVHWQTIEALSTFRPGKNKLELLILFDADGLDRVFHAWALDPNSERALDRFWGGPAVWRPTWEWAAVTPRPHHEARRGRYAALYRERLLGLGYKTVHIRDIRTRGHQGLLKYMLVFATSNATGAKIMDQAFDSVFRGESEPQLPGFEDVVRR